MGELAPPTEQQKQTEAAEATAAKQFRDEVFQQRRDDEFIHEGELYPTADPSGPQDIQTALGHWADWDLGTQQNTNGASKIEREEANSSAAIRDKRLAVNEIHNHYMVNDRDDLAKVRERSPADDHKLDLSSADSRIAELDKLVQNTGNEYDERTCAASSLLGAAVVGGGKKGTEGITKLLDAMNSNADPQTLKYLNGDKTNPGVMTEIRKKIASGEQLSTGDMHLIQNELYNQMQNNETKDAAKKVDDLRAQGASEEEIKKAEQAASAAAEDGIQKEGLEKFLAKSPEFKKMMADNKLNVSYIQNDPNQRKSGHAVLDIGGQAIYDPQMRDDGQIVWDAQEMQNYQTAEAQRIDPSAIP